MDCAQNFRTSGTALLLAVLLRPDVRAGAVPEPQPGVERELRRQPAAVEAAEFAQMLRGHAHRCAARPAKPMCWVR